MRYPIQNVWRSWGTLLSSYARIQMQGCSIFYYHSLFLVSISAIAYSFEDFSLSLVYWSFFMGCCRMGYQEATPYCSRVARRPAHVTYPFRVRIIWRICSKFWKISTSRRCSWKNHLLLSLTKEIHISHCQTLNSSIIEQRLDRAICHLSSVKKLHTIACWGP